MWEKLKSFFEATARYPGLGVYAGCGRYAGFKPSLDRYGLVLNFGWFWIMFITYDFVASSRNVMQEVEERRKENRLLIRAYSGRTSRRDRK